MHYPSSFAEQKRYRTKKPRKFLGFLHVWGGQKVHCVFIDTKPLFSVKIIFEPATTHFSGLFGAGMQKIFHNIVILAAVLGVGIDDIIVCSDPFQAKITA